VNTVEMLRSVDTLEAISDEDLLVLHGALKKRKFRAGEMIFAKGDTSSAMYLVQSGLVNVFLPGEQSSRISLKDISAGEFFGELSMFDEKPRSASAVAVTDTVLLELEQETLEKFLNQRPYVAISMLRSMSERLRETTSLLSTRAAKNVDEEFDKHLSWSDRLADTVAELNGSWKFIVIILLVTAAWCIGNSETLVGSPVDPYPYQFFNLALAILVGLQGPLIVMSQNRQSRKDRARADTDFKVNLKNEVNIEAILKELREARTELRNFVAR